MSNHWGSNRLNMDVRLSGNLNIDISFSWDFGMNIRLSSDLLMHIWLSSNLDINIRLSSDFLMHIRFSSNVFMDIRLSSNFLMDIRFSSRVKVSISNRWVIKSSINSSNWGSNSSNWLSSIAISIRVGIASWGNDTSLCGGQTGKDSNKGSHF